MVIRAVINRTGQVRFLVEVQFKLNMSVKTAVSEPVAGGPSDGGLVVPENPVDGIKKAHVSVVITWESGVRVGRKNLTKTQKFCDAEKETAVLLLRKL